MLSRSSGPRPGRRESPLQSRPRPRPDEWRSNLPPSLSASRLGPLSVSLSALPTGRSLSSRLAMRLRASIDVGDSRPANRSAPRVCPAAASTRRPENGGAVSCSSREPRCALSRPFQPLLPERLSRLSIFSRGNSVCAEPELCRAGSLRGAGVGDVLRSGRGPLRSGRGPFALSVAPAPVSNIVVIRSSLLLNIYIYRDCQLKYPVQEGY